MWPRLLHWAACGLDARFHASVRLSTGSLCSLGASSAASQAAVPAPLPGKMACPGDKVTESSLPQGRGGRGVPGLQHRMGCSGGRFPFYFIFCQPISTALTFTVISFAESKVVASGFLKKHYLIVLQRYYTKCPVYYTK